MVSQRMMDGWVWMGLDWIGLDWIGWMDGFFFHPLLDDNSFTNTNWEQIATSSTQKLGPKGAMLERLRSFLMIVGKLGF